MSKDEQSQIKNSETFQNKRAKESTVDSPNTVGNLRKNTFIIAADDSKAAQSKKLAFNLDKDFEFVAGKASDRKRTVALRDGLDEESTDDFVPATEASVKGGSAAPLNANQSHLNQGK